jgi:hypothetical protein
MVKLTNSWVIMNPGGGPTPDKPDIASIESWCVALRGPATLAIADA